VLTGLRKGQNGKVLLNDKDLYGKSPREIIDSGVGHIPEDRHKRGLILKYSLFENSILGIHKNKEFNKGIMMDYKAIKKYCDTLIEEFDVRTPSNEVYASALSGGNQQKLIAAREISKDPTLLIAAQPTRGIDVGAIEYIHTSVFRVRCNSSSFR